MKEQLFKLYHNESDIESLTNDTKRVQKELDRAVRERQREGERERERERESRRRRHIIINFFHY